MSKNDVRKNILILILCMVIVSSIIVLFFNINKILIVNDVPKDSTKVNNKVDSKFDDSSIEFDSDGNVYEDANENAIEKDENIGNDLTAEEQENNDVQSQSSNNDNQNTDSNDNNINENSDDLIEENIPEESSMASENKRLTDEILQTYRVSILYGNKANYYYNGEASTHTTLADESEINRSLLAIKNGLSNMPQSILDTLRLSNGYNILLFKQLPGGKDGLAVITSHVYQILLDIDNWQQERIFYHETFHIMERYMYLQNGSVDPFPDWNLYNPDGFAYGYGDGKYLYIDNSVPIIDRAFTSKYAKTNQSEDRAELFEDLMHRTRKYYYMEPGYGVNEKAKYLNQVLDYYFGNISDAKWKRWISW